jgi:putative zinc finger/helix-turn-helix YgiT family protein
MNQPKHCPSCKGRDFTEEKLEETREVSGYTFTAYLSVYKCVSCSETLFHLEEIGKFEREISGWLAKEGILSGEAFRFMRKTTGIRAKELARLLDLTPETLSRWEKGHRLPDKKAMMVMGALVLDSLKGEETTMKRLQRLGSSSRAGKSIDLNAPFLAI